MEKVLGVHYHYSKQPLNFSFIKLVLSDTTSTVAAQLQQVEK